MRIVRFFQTFFLLLAATWLLDLPGGRAFAQAGMTGDPLAVCIARVMPGDRTDEVFHHDLRPDCHTAQQAFGSGDFWVRARAVPARAKGQAVAVRVSSLWQDRLTFLARYADGEVIAIPLKQQDISRKLQLGAIIEATFPARAAPLVELGWKVEGAANLRGILTGARIATPGQSQRSNLIMAAVYSGFAGLCIALLIYNLAMYGALRYNFLLAYCAMVLALIVFALSSSGALAWAWSGIQNNDRLRINYVTLAGAATAALVFARTFFEPRVFPPWLARALTLVCANLMVAGLAYGLLAPWRISLLDRYFTLAFLGAVAIIPPILYFAWQQRSNYLWLFALAWAAPVVLAGVRVANGLNAIQWSFWVDNSTILSMTSEALLSSIAISYRIRLLSIERDDARVQEIAARALADTDPLTGLLNRRSFLRHAIGRRGDQMLLVADLDHFKLVNETIGHDGGDEVLRIFARLLRSLAPADALVARIGGEEFAVVAPVGTTIEADDILARLRAERMPFDLRITASIGACSGPLVTESDWKQLYRRADRALYDAKSDGRDRARHGAPLAFAA